MLIAGVYSFSVPIQLNNLSDCKRTPPQKKTEPSVSHPSHFFEINK